MGLLDRLAALKQQVEAVRSDSSRAAGGLDQIMRRLKADHGCDSLEEAEKKLKKYEGDEEATKTAFKQALEKFEVDYAEMEGNQNRETED